MIAAGESQTLELKERLPPQMRDLAKELAAFATSNDGNLLVGVTDGGSIVGLDDLASAKSRDEIRGRVIGICTHGVRPPITPSIDFIEIDGLWVMVLEVKKGGAPLYYVQNVPFLRHLTSSRPAEPQEVIDLVLAWAKADAGLPSEEEAFLNELLPLLNSVTIAAGEANDRDFGHWLESQRFGFDSDARSVRALTLRVPATLDGLLAKLEDLAGQLDIAAHVRMGMNFG